MPRPTRREPERGDARTRLLIAARTIVRRQGFAATTVDALCAEAGVTKGAFFHHFNSKDELGIEAARFWTATVTEFFAGAPYHTCRTPLERLLAYVDFRRSIIRGDLAEWTCLAGTLAQEVYQSHPGIREACAESIFSHAATLEADIAAAMRARRMDDVPWTPASLARHTQAVLQGAFILAKAAGDPAVAVESVDHLRRYLELLFHGAEKKGKRTP